MGRSCPTRSPHHLANLHARPNRIVYDLFLENCTTIVRIDVRTIYLRCIHKWSHLSVNEGACSTWLALETHDQVLWVIVSPVFVYFRKLALIRICKEVNPTEPNATANTYPPYEATTSQ